MGSRQTCGADFLIICSSSFQVGWFQDQITRSTGLIRFGAKPLRDGTHRWILPNGTIVQFSIISDEVYHACHMVRQGGEIVLLYEADRYALDDPAGEIWYLTMYLRELAAQRDIQVIHFHELVPQLQVDWNMQQFLLGEEPTDPIIQVP